MGLSDLLITGSYFHLLSFYHKKIEKRNVSTGIWSSGEETSRVLAFLTINRLTVMKQEALLEFVLKQMYMAYVKNCEYISQV